MKFPNIHDYDNGSDYFRDFYQINKNENRPISFRGLAKKLNWPFSYFSDVIHNRKPLTISRAVEFSQFAQFNPVETERLIFMTLKDHSSNDKVQDFFHAKLTQGHISDYASDQTLSYGGYPNDYNTSIDELKNDMHAGVLIKYLSWCNGKTLKRNVGELLFTFPEFKDIAFLDKRIDWLVKNGNIQIVRNDDNHLEVKLIKSYIHFNYDRSKIHQVATFTDHMSKLIRHKDVKGFFNNGFIRVRGQDLREIIERIGILRNWISELEKVEPDSKEVTLLFEYGLNLGVLFDIEKAGVPSLKEWGAL